MSSAVATVERGCGRLGGNVVMSLKMIQSTVARPAFSATVFSPACTAAPPINTMRFALLQC